MDCDNIIKWCDALIPAWQNNDLENVLLLFDENCECDDNPFAEKGNVADDWKEILNQEIKSIYKNILSINKNECIVEFAIDYGNEKCNAINHIKFNEYNTKCIYIKQWYMCQ